MSPSVSWAIRSGGPVTTAGDKVSRMLGYSAQIADAVAA
jgi:hypothetical protein